MYVFFPLYSLSGMWGIKLYRNITIVRTAVEGMLNGTVHNHDYDYDQQLLKDFIWPIAKFDSVKFITFFLINL